MFQNQQQRRRRRRQGCCLLLQCTVACAFLAALGLGQDLGDLLDGVPSDLPVNISDLDDILPQNVSQTATDCVSRVQDLSSALSSADSICQVYPCSSECLGDLEAIHVLCRECYNNQCPPELSSLNVSEITARCEAEANRLCDETENTFFNCSAGRAMTASWCRFQNPFIVPRPLPWPEVTSAAGIGGTDFPALADQYEPEYDCTQESSEGSFPSSAWDASCRLVDAFSAIEAALPDSSPYNEPSSKIPSAPDGVTHFVIAKAQPTGSSLTVIVNPVTEQEIWSDRNETHVPGRVAMQAAVPDLEQPANYFIVQACNVVTSDSVHVDASARLRLRYVSNTSVSDTGANLNAQNQTTGPSATTSTPLRNSTNQSATMNVRGRTEEPQTVNRRFVFSVDSLDVRLQNMAIYRGLSNNDLLLSFVVDEAYIIGVPISRYRGAPSAEGDQVFDGMVFLRLFNGSVSRTTLLWNFTLTSRVLSLKATRHHWQCDYGNSDDVQTFFKPDNLHGVTALDSTCAKAQTIVTVVTTDGVLAFAFADEFGNDTTGTNGTFIPIHRTQDANITLDFERRISESSREPTALREDEMVAAPLIRYTASLVDDMDIDTLPQSTGAVRLDTSPHGPLFWTLFNTSQLIDLGLDDSESVSSSTYNIAAAEFIVNRWPKLQSPLSLASYLGKGPPSAQAAWLVVALNPKRLPVYTENDADNATVDDAARILTFALTAFNSMGNTSIPDTMNPCGLPAACGPQNSTTPTPLFAPNASVCESPNCQRGLNCDDLIALVAFNFTCATLEAESSCDCRGCQCTATKFQTTPGPFAKARTPTVSCAVSSNGASSAQLVDSYRFPEPSVRIESMSSAWRAVATQFAEIIGELNLSSTPAGVVDQFGDMSSVEDGLQGIGVSSDDASATATDLVSCLESSAPESCSTNALSTYQDALSGLSSNPSSFLSLLGVGGVTDSTAIDNFDADDVERLYGLHYVLHFADQDRSVHTFHASSMPQECTSATVDVSSQDGDSSLDGNKQVTSEPLSTTALPYESLVTSALGTTSNTSTVEVPLLSLQRVNKLSVLGNVDSMSSSPNGQHLFIKTSRERWELLSMERIVEICARLAEDISDPFLEPFIPACFQAMDATSVPRFPRADDFVMTASACITGTLCTSFNQENVTEISPGFHSDFHFDVAACARGFYCSAGISVPCPRGFFCPNEGLSLPVRCPLDPTSTTTCYDVGLSEPLPCPEGYLCHAPHVAPIPVRPGAAAAVTKHPNKLEVQSFVPPTAGTLTPEGPNAAQNSSEEVTKPFEVQPVIDFYDANEVQDKIQQLYRVSGSVDAASDFFDVRAAYLCPQGAWCPLARSTSSSTNISTLSPANELACPAGFFCSNSSVLLPAACSRFIQNESGTFAVSCPGGTVSASSLCPAGYFCRSQDGTKLPCSNGSFCPAGSATARLCEAGAYCPNVTAQLVCPSGTFCPEGSIAPVPCSMLDVCPQASATPIRLTVIVMIASLMLATLLALKVVPRVRHTTPTGVTSQRRRAVVVAVSSAVPPIGTSDAPASLATNRVRRVRDGRKRPSVDESGTTEKGVTSLTSRVVDITAESKAIDVEFSDENNAEEAPAATVTDLPSGHGPIDISFENLGLRLKSQRKSCAGSRKKAASDNARQGVILEGVTGTLHSGRATAVMGPSGAGKTTFITTLTSKAYYGDRTGKVAINGQEDDLARYKTRTGFVPQDDVMMLELTARENLYFSARARLPRSQTDTSVKSVVADTLKLLGLVADRDSIVSELSSGKRKAVNIGMELVAQPQLLFVDEPTTGLDSTSSLTICSTLRRIARRGLTVVAVVHQPRFDAFRMFDDVLLLGKGGRTVYLGPTEGVLPYFESVGYHCPPRANPADFLLDVVAGQYMRDVSTTRSQSSLPISRNSGDGVDEAEPAYDGPADNHASTDSNSGSADLFQLWIQFGGLNTGNDSGGRGQPKQSGEQPLGAALPSVHRPQLNLFPLCALYLGRALIQQRRNAGAILADFLVVVFAAVFLGLLYFDKSQGRGNTHLDDGFGPTTSSSSSADQACEYCAWMSLGDPKESFFGCPGDLADVLPPVSLALGDQILSRGSMCCIAVGLTSVTAFMKVFSHERTVYFRENAGLAT